jgi:flagellar motility protein MotE (MotC chaperone)
MTKLEKIEHDISALSKADLRKLSDWLDEYKSDLWDRQIEADARSGKLDKLVAEAKAQAAAGKIRPL